MSITVNPQDQKVTPAYGDVTELTDSKGRTLGFRALNALEQSRICLIVGAEASMNAAYMTGYAMPVCSVRVIDGEAVAMPKNMGEIEFLIQKLDDAGISAVLRYSLAEQKKAAEEQQLKNS